MELTKQAIPLLKNPHVLARMIETNRRILCPYWQELIEEGQRDGSVTTENAKEMAELLVLMDIWLIPSVFPADEEGMKRRYLFISEMFAKMGFLFTMENWRNVGKASLFNSKKKISKMM